MAICRACGREFNSISGSASRWRPYCSARCKLDGEQAKALGGGVHSSGGGSLQDLLSNPRRLKIVIPIVVIMLIIGGIGVAVDGIRNAFSDTKIKIVSAACETQEEFVSILENALSEVSGTEIEGEEFTTYSQQALVALKERESLFKDSVFSVTLPDNIGVYVWFKTKDEPSAYVYRTE